MALIICPDCNGSVFNESHRLPKVRPESSILDNLEDHFSLSTRSDSFLRLPFVNAVLRYAQSVSLLFK